MTFVPSGEATTILNVALLTLYALMLALCVRQGAVAIPAAWRSPRRRQLLLETLALFLPALGLRLFLAPCAPYHGEGPEYALIDASCRPFLAPTHWPYHGGAGPIVYGVFIRLFPYAERTVYVLNAVLGSLSVLLVRDVAQRLVGSRTVAITAALLFALLPSQIRLSCSESLMNPLVFQWLLALSLALRLRTDSRWFEWALVVVLAVAATNTRPCGFVILPLLAIAAWPRLVERPVRLLWGVPLVVGLVPVWIAVGGEISAGGLSTSRLANFWSTQIFRSAEKNPWWLPQVTPWLLHPVAQAAGAIVLVAKKRWRAALTMVVAIAATEALVLSQTVSLLIGLRFTAPSAPFVAILGGVVAGALVDGANALVRIPAVVLVAGLLVASNGGHLVEHVRLVTFEGNLQAEYRFLQRSISQLPDRSLVVTAAHWQRDTHYAPSFSTCIARRYGVETAHADLAWIDDLASECRRYPGGVYAFVGLYCYSFAVDNAAMAAFRAPALAPIDGATPLDTLLGHYAGKDYRHSVTDDLMIPACDDMKRRFPWTPVSEARVPNRPDLWFSVPSRELTFGLYRLNCESP